MTHDIELTEAEKIARDHFKKLASEGLKVLCDDEITIQTSGLPVWYNEDLYKRGQEYFHQNRTAILYSNYIGLLAALAVPRGNTVLKATGRSETAEAARQRNLAIAVHTLAWYEYDLTPGSQSLKSLNRARRMHYLASKAIEKKGIPGINQSETAMLAVGFMGLALVRPEAIGCRPPTEEEKKAFIHFWAVVCHMIGVKEPYNICLLPIDAFVVFCQLMIRYVFLPLMQINSNDFEILTQAVIVGLKPYLLHQLDHEADMFFAKRMFVVPGYQFNVSREKEVLCRSILNQQDVDELNELTSAILGDEVGWHMTVDIPIISVEKCNGNNISSEEAFKKFPYLRRMKLKSDECITVRMVNYETEWQSCLNNSKFYDLPLLKKLLVLERDVFFQLYKNIFGRYTIEWFVTKVISRMRNIYKVLRIPVNNNTKWINNAQ